MATATTTTTTISSSSHVLRTTSPNRKPLRSLRKSYKSTPNLNAAYTLSSSSSSSSLAPSSSNRLAPPLPPVPPVPPLPRLALMRKASLAALTQSSLATVPDVRESYILNSVLSEGEPMSMSQSSPRINMAPPPTTPGRLDTADEANVTVGDIVDVPGNMHGTVRFVGSVQGKKGVFAGVELSSEFASKGKNNGDVDSISYFTCDTPGAGIFLPASKASRRGSPATLSTASFPITPTGSGGLRAANQNSTNFTPPTPGLSKFSLSVGPGGSRAASPFGKKPRTSLPRPDSPVRRAQAATPSASRPSVNTTTSSARSVSRYASPTSTRFAQSVRGDPAKKIGESKRPLPGPRSASALSHHRSGSALGHLPRYDDDDPPQAVLRRTKTNGSAGSISSLNPRLRPASRANTNDTEVDRLRVQLEDRDKQLMDQAASLAEMENSLAEVQSLMENPDVGAARRGRGGSVDDKNAQQLRAMMREKNEKISMLTAEFDAHRADFRSTIDALETASTETQKLYEKRIEELTQEIKELETGRLDNIDVNSVASQLKQLEELVQELEEGLEDARRGEAEARGEVEFLRGEVERTRSELRREREKATANMNGTRASSSKELERKDDEIRGLKAIIHSLSRDSVPGGGGDGSDKTPSRRPGSNTPSQGDTAESRQTRDKLEREIAELQNMMSNRNSREAELEKEIESLRRASMQTANHRTSVMTTASTVTRRSSIRDSRDTVVTMGSGMKGHTRFDSRSSDTRRPSRLETMPESDAYSTATENSTLWCEMCEASGHDILSCSSFGADAGRAHGPSESNDVDVDADMTLTTSPSKSVPAHMAAVAGTGSPNPKHNNGLMPLKLVDNLRSSTEDTFKPAPLTAAKSIRAAAATTSPLVKIIPNPMESGPVAGKESGVVDEAKWCAICERDGHDSVDCPFEDAF